MSALDYEGQQLTRCAQQRGEVIRQAPGMVEEQSKDADALAAVVERECDRRRTVSVVESPTGGSVTSGFRITRTNALALQCRATNTAGSGNRFLPGQKIRRQPMCCQQSRLVVVSRPDPQNPCTSVQ